MDALTAKRRSELRAEAHKLRPVVIIGDKGLTDEVLAEIDRSLTAHELVKVRAAAGERGARDAWLGTICSRLAAHAVQQIGKVLVVYRENPQEAKPKPAREPAPREGARAVVVTERGRQRQRSRDEKKRKERDIVDMLRKGKIKPKAEREVVLRGKSDPRGKLGPRGRPGPGQRGDAGSAGTADATRTSRPRSRTPSPLPESGPRRRRPRTSR